LKFLLLLLLFVTFVFASVDINKADKKELETLHGIGVKKAEKIISFRKENGCFESIEDLAKVKGIGPKTIEKNRKNLTLSECE